MFIQKLRCSLLLLSAAILFACGGKSESGIAPKADDAGGLIYFSKTPGRTGREDPSNWCFSKYKEAVVINADRLNVNKRYFYLTQGAHRILLEDGNRKQSFIVRPNKKGRLELFTSANLPMCLSNRSYFTLSPDGHEFSFDNGRTIKFTFSADIEQGAFKCIIEFPPGLTHGLAVNPCVDCPDL